MICKTGKRINTSNCMVSSAINDKFDEWELNIPP